MSPKRKMFGWLRALFQKQRLDARMDDEMRSHVEMQTQENIEAGMKSEEARYAALRQFGWVESIKETAREQRGVSWIENLGQDVRYGARALRKNAGFTVVAVMTLALGIGANTAIFSLVDAVLVKSLPVRQPNRLFFVTSGNNAEISYPLINSFQKANGDVGETLAYRTLKVRLNAGAGNDAAISQLVSGNYFSALGVATALGRPILTSDDRPEAPPVTVISHGCWERRFGRDPAALGKTLQLSGVDFTIVGVAPRRFHGLDAQAVPEAYAPIRQHALLNPGEPRLLEEYGNWVFTALVRLNAGVTEDSARSRLTDIYRRVVSENSQWVRAKDLPEVLNRGVRLSPAGQGVAKLREKFSRPLLVLMAASGLVFLVACANVSSLVLARGASRGRELALRLAVGAGRWRVARLLLVESLLLAAGGCALGLVLAAWSSRGLARFLPEDAAGIVSDAGLNGRLLVFAMLASLGATVLVGLAPALRGSKISLSVALGGGGRIFAHAGVLSRFGKSLVISQVALSLMLLVVAGLLLRSMRELAALDPGFRRENVLLLTVRPELTGYSESDRDKVAAKLAAPDLLERVEAIPGVLSAGLSSAQEFGGRSWWRMAVKPTGETARSDDQTGAAMRWVTPGHFETHGITVLRGRPMNSRDSFAAPKVAVINETMARQYFGGAESLGRRFKLSSGLEALGEIEVVGIVRDVKSASLRTSSAATFYLPFAQFPNTENLEFAVRCAGSPEVVVAEVRKIIESLDSNLVVSKITTLSKMVDASLAQERASATLSAGFSVLALLLAAVGLGGALWYAAGERTREIGVRMALGARRRDVALLITRQGMKLVFFGVIAGLAGAAVFSRFLAVLLFGVSPMDAETFLASASILILAGFVACWLPASRAARVDPMVALRAE